MGNILSEKAVIADVIIRGWSGRKLDRKVTSEVNEQHHAVADAGRFNKLLIAKEAFTDVWGIERQARVQYILKTLPWSDNKNRLLPTAMYDEFASAFRKFKNEHGAAADVFAKRYPEYVKKGKERLNTMWNAEDYPDPSRVRQMFSFHVSIRPCPDVDDFRISLGKEQMEDIRSGLKQELKEALQETMQEPVRRIIKVVERMASKLKNYKPATDEDRAENTFRDSLVDNVRELMPLIEAFNLTGNKEITKLSERMAKELCKNDAETLREDEDIRKKVAKAAEDILKQANALMA